MSDPHGSDAENDTTPIPDDPVGEAREQLAENDEHLREGDEPTLQDTVPRHNDVDEEEERGKHDEDEQANHLLHDEGVPDPRIEP